MHKKKTVSIIITILLVSLIQPIYAHITINNDLLHAVNIELTCEGPIVGKKTVAGKKKAHMRVHHSRCSNHSSLSKLQLTATTHKKHVRAHILEKNVSIHDGDIIKIKHDGTVTIIQGHLRG